MKLAMFCLVGVLLFGVACGGGSSSTSISQSEAVDVADNYLKTTLGLFTGTTDPQAFIDQYAPECRTSVDPEAIGFVSAFMQGLAPSLNGIEIQAVDVGSVKVEQTEDGVLITPVDPSAMRIEVNGEFVAADDFMAQAGFVPTEQGDFAAPLHLVRRDGKVYLGDCSELEGLAGGPLPAD